MPARRSRRTRKEPPEVVPRKSDEDDEAKDSDDADEDDKTKVSTKNSKKPDAQSSQRRSKRSRKPTTKSTRSVATRRTRRNSNSSGEGRSKGDTATSESSGDENDNEPSPRRTRATKRTRSSKSGDESSEDEDSNEESSSEKSLEHTSGKEEGNADQDDGDDDDSDNEPLSAKIKRKGLTSKASKARASADEDEEGDQSEEATAKEPLVAATGGTLPATRRSGRGSRRRTKADGTAKTPTLSEDESADAEEPPRKRTRGRPRRTRAKDKDASASEEDRSPPESEDEKTEKKATRSTRSKRTQEDLDENDSDNEQSESDKDTDSKPVKDTSDVVEKSEKDSNVDLSTQGTSKAIDLTADEPSAAESESSRGSRRSQRNQEKPSTDETLKDEAPKKARGSEDDDQDDKKRSERKRKLSVVEAGGEEEEESGEASTKRAKEADKDEVPNEGKETPAEKAQEKSEDVMETDSIPAEEDKQKDLESSKSDAEDKSSSVSPENVAKKSETSDEVVSDTAVKSSDDKQEAPEKVEEPKVAEENGENDKGSATNNEKPVEPQQTSVDHVESEKVEEGGDDQMALDAEEKKDAGDQDSQPAAATVPESVPQSPEETSIKETKESPKAKESKASTESKETPPADKSTEKTQDDVPKAEDPPATDDISSKGDIVGKPEKEESTSTNEAKATETVVEQGIEKAEGPAQVDAVKQSAETAVVTTGDRLASEPTQADKATNEPAKSASEPAPEPVPPVDGASAEDYASQVERAQAGEVAEPIKMPVALDVEKPKPTEGINGTEVPTDKVEPESDAMEVEEITTDAAKAVRDTTTKPASTTAPPAASAIEKQTAQTTADSTTKEAVAAPPSTKQQPIAKTAQQQTPDSFQEAKAKVEESDDDQFHDAHMELPSDAATSPDAKTREASTKKMDVDESTPNDGDKVVPSDTSGEAKVEVLDGDNGNRVNTGEDKAPTASTTTDEQGQDGSLKRDAIDLVSASDVKVENGPAEISKADTDAPKADAAVSEAVAIDKTKAEAAPESPPVDVTPPLLPEDFEKHHKIVFGPRFEQKKAKNPPSSAETNVVDILDKMKSLLYMAGSKVHRGRGCERVFSEYWDAMSLRLSNRLSSHTSAQCEKAVMAFLKTRKLRKLHNRLVMSIMRQASQSRMELDRVEAHMPASWKSRVAKKDKHNVASPVQVVSEPKPADLVKSEPAAPKAAEKFYQESWERPAPSETAVTNQTRRQKVLVASKRESSSSCIPGVLAVEPVVRNLAGQQDLQVPDTAVWLVVVALKEHMKNVLKASIAQKDALSRGELEGPTHSFPRVLATPSKSSAKKDPSSDSTKDASPKHDRTKPSTKLSVLDLYMGLSSLPSGEIGSLGGSVSRSVVERCLYSAFDNLPVQPKRDFDEVHDYVTEQIFVEARTRKVVPKAVREADKSRASAAAATAAAASRTSDQSFAVPPPAPAPARKPEATARTSAPAAANVAAATPDGGDSSAAALRGMGRGAKNLAAMMRRSTSPGDTKASGGGVGGEEPETSKTAATTIDTTGAAGEEEDGQKRGKGFGKKNLAAMRARASSEGEKKE